MADKAVITQRKPYKVDAQPGTYWWCACGRSAKQPFCDGSHKTTTFTPMKVEISQAGPVYLCGCKHAKNPPFCDGTHKHLPEQE